MNQEASRRATLRDRFNQETREKVDEAHSHRERRDELNGLVQSTKDERDEMNAKASELFKGIGGEKKKDPRDKKEKSLEALEKEIQSLEFRQQTEVLTGGKERKLIDKIADLKDKYSEKKKQMEVDQVEGEKKREADQFRGKASALHREMIRLADEAQVEHNQMIESYRLADQIRNEADEIHAKFIRAQELADTHHEWFIKVQKKLRKLDKTEDSSRQTVKEAAREEAKREGEEIYERFKKGQALGTEDLMKLQKAGLL